jgi:hypothetical protein
MIEEAEFLKEVQKVIDLYDGDLTEYSRTNLAVDFACLPNPLKMGEMLKNKFFHDPEETRILLRRISPFAYKHGSFGFKPYCYQRESLFHISVEERRLSLKDYGDVDVKDSIKYYYKISY